MLRRAAHVSPRVSPRVFGRVLGLVVALQGAMALGPGKAAAADSDVPRSVALYEQGRKLLEGGDCAKAVPLFEQSLRLNESIGAHLSIAECRGDDAALAWREYKLAEALARKKNDDRVRYAHDHAAALESRLGLVRVVLPPGGKATLDDKPVDDEPVAVTPGHHTVDFTSSDGTRSTRAIDINAGKSLQVTADEPAPQRPFVEHPSTESLDHDPGKGRRLVGIVVAGGGVAVAIAGGVFAFLASSKLDDAKTACSEYPRCSSDTATSARDANDAGRTDALIATIGLGVGLGAIAIGAVLYFTAPKEVWATRALTTAGRGLQLAF